MTLECGDFSPISIFLSMNLIRSATELRRGTLQRNNGRDNRKRRLIAALQTTGAAMFRLKLLKALGHSHKHFVVIAAVLLVPVAVSGMNIAAGGKSCAKAGQQQFVAGVNPVEPERDKLLVRQTVGNWVVEFRRWNQLVRHAGVILCCAGENTKQIERPGILFQSRVSD